MTPRVALLDHLAQLAQLGELASLIVKPHAFLTRAALNNSGLKFFPWPQRAGD
jgi:hypothetical protein